MFTLPTAYPVFCSGRGEAADTYFNQYNSEYITLSHAAVNPLLNSAIGPEFTKRRETARPLSPVSEVCILFVKIFYIFKYHYLQAQGTLVTSFPLLYASRTASSTRRHIHQRRFWRISCHLLFYGTIPPPTRSQRGASWRRFILLRRYR